MTTTMTTTTSMTSTTAAATAAGAGRIARGRRDGVAKGGRPHRRHPALLGAALAALALALTTGCGGATDDDGAGAAHRTSTGGPDATARTPGRTSPSPRPSTPGPAFSAADGTDTGACSDGNCEITVSAPVTLRFPGPRGKATLSVTEVGPGKVAYAITSGGNSSKGSASGPGQGCLTVVRADGGGNSCGGIGDAAPPSPQPDAVVIQVAAGADGTALLQIVS
ncbi:hypothetical protein [Streptomyces sp. SID5785]|uniref:hypothetical protein n=1 Tax=Streptomyces sp. SID5785 TaxID=2690309 RepID=UPI001927D464|nr:hypothetical protein [Streptomyces sp. SID5785]